MRFLALGATGATGTQFVSLALAAGHDVTAYVRSPAKMAQSPKLTVVSGAAADADQLATVLPGHDAVISMLGRPGPGKTDQSLIEDSTRALLRAAELTGVTRLIVMSSFGVGNSYSKGSLIGKIVYKRVLAGVFADKARGEARLRATRLDWTIVYPVALTNKPASNHVVATPLADAPKLHGIAKISRADVATFLLQAAVDGSFNRQTVVLRQAD